MATTPVTPTPDPTPAQPVAVAVATAPAAPSPAHPDIAKTILNDVIAAGLVAASLFVKNPASQQHASTIIQAVTPLIQLLESQL